MVAGIPSELFNPYVASSVSLPGIVYAWPLILHLSDVPVELRACCVPLRSQPRLLSDALFDPPPDSPNLTHQLLNRVYSG